MNGESCRGCRYWRPWTNQPTGRQAYGECRRHSPVLVPHPKAERGENYMSRWPSTRDTDWCGTFKVMPEDQVPMPEPLARGGGR